MVLNRNHNWNWKVLRTKWKQKYYMPKLVEWNKQTGKPTALNAYNKRKAWKLSQVYNLRWYMRNTRINSKKVKKGGEIDQQNLQQIQSWFFERDPENRQNHGRIHWGKTRELTNKSISRHTCNFINSFILQMFLIPVILLSFRNTTKIKAHKSLSLMVFFVLEIQQSYRG